MTRQKPRGLKWHLYDLPTPLYIPATSPMATAMAMLMFHIDADAIPRASPSASVDPVVELGHGHVLQVS